MANYGSYLVCKEHLQEIREFLGQFFDEQKNKYTHDGWVTFEVPHTGFLINLMKGKEQPMTQHMTFEIYCNSLEQLAEYARVHGKPVENFVATETGNDYRYHYIEIPGPHGICKVEINYCEDVN